MFEHIGRDYDEEAPRRRAQSIGLLALIVGAGGFCAGILTLVVVDSESHGTLRGRAALAVGTQCFTST